MLVAPQHGLLSARLRVPQPHRPIGPTAGQPAAVSAPRHRGHFARVAPQHGLLSARLRVPQPHRPIVPTAGQPAAVSAPRHRVHPARVAGCDSRHARRRSQQQPSAGCLELVRSWGGP